MGDAAALVRHWGSAAGGCRVVHVLRGVVAALAHLCRPGLCFRALLRGVGPSLELRGGLPGSRALLGCLWGICGLAGLWLRLPGSVVPACTYNRSLMWHFRSGQSQRTDSWTLKCTAGHSSLGAARHVHSTSMSNTATLYWTAGCSPVWSQARIAGLAGSLALLLSWAGRLCRGLSLAESLLGPILTCQAGRPPLPR